MNLRKFVNYRHPGPRRVWKVGSELQSTTLDPVDPLDLSGSECRVPKYGFVYAKPHFSLPRDVQAQARPRMEARGMLKTQKTLFEENKSPCGHVKDTDYTF